MACWRGCCVWIARYGNPLNPLNRPMWLNFTTICLAADITDHYAAPQKPVSDAGPCIDAPRHCQCRRSWICGRHGKVGVRTRKLILTSGSVHCREVVSSDNMADKPCHSRETKLFSCWASVRDAGQTLKQPWWYLLTYWYPNQINQYTSRLVLPPSHVAYHNYAKHRSLGNTELQGNIIDFTLQPGKSDRSDNPSLLSTTMVVLIRFISR